MCVQRTRCSDVRYRYNGELDRQEEIKAMDE